MTPSQAPCRGAPPGLQLTPSLSDPILGALQGFSWNQTGQIAAGSYSAVHAVFPGAVMGNTTWSAADSRTTPLPDESFTVQPVRSLLFKRLWYIPV